MDAVCPPELWPRDGEPQDSVPQAECLSKEPPELHPGPAEGRPLRWTSFPKITQRFSYLSGGPHRCSQEPARLARQVKFGLALFQKTILRDYNCSKSQRVRRKKNTNSIHFTIFSMRSCLCTFILCCSRKKPISMKCWKESW